MDNPSIRYRGDRTVTLAVSALVSATCIGADVIRPAPVMEDAARQPSLEGASIDELLNVRVTTVSREESTVGQSPAAVFVINQEMIRRSGATMIPELLRMVPGLAVARIDGNKWAVASRGFNNRFAKNLLVQVDGRTVYHPLIAGVFWETVDYPLADIERIEVIRGPGASVWGANAVNGIINIITKSSRDTKGGYFSAGGGEVAHGFTDFRFGGQLGDDVTYRLYGKGYNVDEQFSLDGNPNDQWWRATGGLRLDWQATERDTVMLDAGFTRTAAGAKDRFALKEGPPFSVAIPETETRDSAHVLARWSRQLDAESSWAIQAYWDRFILIGDSGYRNARWHTYDLDFQHQFPLGQRQKIVWGLGFRYIDGDLTNSNPDDAFSLDWLENDPHSQLLSAFVQDQIAVVPDRLTMMLGTKVEHNSFTGWELQPTGRLLWTPTKRQAAWAAVSRAVRTPSFTEDDVRLTLPNANPALRPAARLVANRNLEAEEVWAYELGYRAQATDALSVDAALFYNVHNALRATRGNPALARSVDGIPLGAAQFFNAMDGETYGVELAVNWRVTDWWRLHGNYTLLQTKMHLDPADLGVHLGNPSPAVRADLATSAKGQEVGVEGNSPQQLVYVQSSWNLPRDVQFDVIGRWVDRLHGFNPSRLPGVSDTVEDYVTLDARLAWRASAHVEFSIVGQNLLDNHHPEFGTNPFVRSPLTEVRRAVYGQITFTW